MANTYLHKKLFVLGLSATLVSSTFVACSEKSNNTNSKSSDTIESTEISEDTKTSESVYAKVQSIDGNSVTAIKGDLNTDVGANATPPSGDASTPPEMPADNGTDSSGNAPSGDAATPPEKPADNGTDNSGTVPSNDGNAPADMPSGNPGGGTTFVEGTDTFTFTVTDDTSITVEFLQGSEVAIFENVEYGKKAHKYLLTNVYGTSSINDMLYKYAPPSENDTEAYVKFVCNRTGLSKSAIIGSLSDSQLSALEEAMSTYEGFISGRIVPTNQQPVFPN